MPDEEQTTLNQTTQRKRKKQYAASTSNNSSLEDSSSRLKALRSNNSCCSSSCTGKIKEDMNTCFCCCAVQRIGEMLVLVEKDDGTPVFIVGPEWHFCVFCTVPMILIVTFLVTYFILVDDDSSNVSLLYYITSKFLTVFQPLWIVPIYLSIAVLTLVSLCLVGCRDPGNYDYAN